MTFADSFICKFNSLSHGITFKKENQKAYIWGFFCIRYTYLITDIIFKYGMNEPYFSQQSVLTKQINDTHNWRHEIINCRRNDVKYHNFHKLYVEFFVKTCNTTGRSIAGCPHVSKLGLQAFLTAAVKLFC